MKPIIGISAYTEPTQLKKVVNVSYHYVDAINVVGGLPIVIPEFGDLDMLNEYLELIDGLIITGGLDVTPYLYGENPLKEVSYFSVERDNFEIAMVKGAVERGIPVFGICRGIQIINVALGGTLYQDIEQQTETVYGHYSKNIPVDRLYHNVNIEEGTALRTLFDDSSFLVNSFHHQAIKELGFDLFATAYSDDGIIEAVEMKNNNLVYGVQWHPEDLVNSYPMFRSLFKHLVDLSFKAKEL